MIKIKSKNLSDKVKKNLLDLEFAKNLQYLNTTIIIIFTYLIGLGIALLLRQINLKDGRQVGLIIFVSIIFFSITFLLILSFKGHLKDIKTEVKKLKL